VFVYSDSVEEVSQVNLDVVHQAVFVTIFQGIVRIRIIVWNILFTAFIRAAADTGQL